MTYEKVIGIDHYIADDGKCFVHRGDDIDTAPTELWLSGSDSIDNFVEMDIPEQSGDNETN